MKIPGSVLAVVLFVLAVASPAVASDPSFERAFGSGVNGGIGFENCTVAPNCVTGLPSTAAGGMNQNSDVVFDRQGGMLVADYTNNRVNRFLVNPDGSVNFDRTFGYGVQDLVPPAFQNCMSNCKIGLTTDSAGGFNGPWKLAIDNSGRLLVAEYTNSRISRFLIAADGTVTFDRAFGWDVNNSAPGGGLESCTAANCQSGQNGSGAAGELAGPDGIAVDSTGAIYVGEYNNDRITRFTVADDGTPTFDRAFGLDVDPAGGTGFENCTTATGCMAGVTGIGEYAAGSTANNYEVQVGPDGRIFVADYASNRVDVFSRGGDGVINFQQAFGEDVDPGGGTGFETCTLASGCQVGGASGVAGSMYQVVGLELDPAGGLFVMAEGDKRFNHFLPANGSNFTFDYAYGNGVAGGMVAETCRVTCVSGSNTGRGGAFNAPQGIGLSPDKRSFYVADYDNNRVQKFAVGPNVTVTNQSTPADDAGRFDLKVGDVVVKAGAASGESGTTRAGIGTVTVSEVATSSADPLSNYNTTIDCGSGPVAGASLAVPNVSSDISCVISNVRKPPATVNFSKLVLKPKSKTVKAGKKVQLKVSVTNTGNSTGTATVKITSSSKKKATAPKTVKVTVGPGKTVTKKFTVRTKKKKSGKVKITAKLGTKTAKTVLKLKR